MDTEKGDEKMFENFVDEKQKTLENKMLYRERPGGTTGNDIRSSRLTSGMSISR